MIAPTIKLYRNCSKVGLSCITYINIVFILYHAFIIFSIL
nr:MAG TPA: hypothetical protein [Caudoviricetes sp.]